MATNSTVASRPRSRALLAGCVGLFVEWFDFGIFALSVPILAAHFFPSDNVVLSTLMTFATFGVAFLARPLGGAFFGALGDRRGRKVSLTVIVLLMGAATFGIGIMPSYASIGVAAPVLIVLCRLLQGFSAGGENAGAFSLLIESAPEGRKGLWGSMGVVFNIIPSVVAGAVVVLLQTSLGDDAYADWGWRIPFLIGGALGVIGLIIRRKLDETPEYTAAKETNRITAHPIRDAWRHHKSAMVIVFFLSALNGLLFYILGAFAPTALGTFAGFSHATAVTTNMIVMLAVAAIIPLAGAMSDRVGRVPLLIAGSAMAIVASVPALMLLLNGTLWGAVTGQLLLGVSIAMFSTGYGIIQVEMFPPEVRYTAISLSYNLSYVVFAGTVPFVSTFLVDATGTAMAPGVYLAVVAVIGLVTSCTIPRFVARHSRIASEPQLASAPAQERD